MLSPYENYQESFLKKWRVREKHSLDRTRLKAINCKAKSKVDDEG